VNGSKIGDIFNVNTTLGFTLLEKI
jgi:hypothetical protein